MELRSLELFLYLADSLHFGQTSEAMHVSPSTLSRHIQRLEQEAEVTLFERDNRSVKLTPAGKRFRQFARKTLDAWQYFQQSNIMLPGVLSGKLRVFCSVTASYSHLPPLLNRLTEKHPNIDIQLETGDVSLAMQKVSRDEVDVAISAKPDKVPSNLAFSSFANIPLALIAPNGKANFSEQLNQKPTQWETLPFIVAETGLTRKRGEAWFKQMGFQPNIYARVMGHEAIVAMVALGLGVGIAPKIVVENSPVREKIQVLNSDITIEPFELGVCCLNKRLDDSLISAFWQEAEALKQPPQHSN
ncbi:HTH-type transcriptional activator IlvY [Catenovulum sp. SM1970]|uniref:HTH-type transcriptional activator IlvY n=1 Tax=Marinifaba aquimaris TaxID=2741323 RepID=UPI001572A1A6|nr:HTH-type transcriptional activator IlvY [Marinifaba aquimaris]NTS77291.1 HTH-type transcriptional activator IlvY [Marinifaba aquimaris]